MITKKKKKRNSWGKFAPHPHNKKQSGTSTVFCLPQSGNGWVTILYIKNLNKLQRLTGIIVVHCSHRQTVKMVLRDMAFLFLSQCIVQRKYINNNTKMNFQYVGY